MKSKAFGKKLTLNKKTIADLKMDKVKGAYITDTLKDCYIDTSAMPECSAMYRCTCGTCYSGDPGCANCIIS
jgi:hypothetical protein